MEGYNTKKQQQQVLTSLPFFDELRANETTNVIRNKGNNLDLLTISDGEEIALCHLSGLFAFTQGRLEPAAPSFEEAAAVALASHHLNVGDGSIVPEVEGLDKRCQIRFTTEFADTKFNPGAALKQVLEMTNRQPGEELLPCAFVGVYRSAISIPTSIVSGIRGYLQVSGASTSANLDDKSQYPLFGRTIPSDRGNAIPIILYMRDVLRISHLAVIHVSDAYGTSFVEGLRIARDKLAPDMIINPNTPR